MKGAKPRKPRTRAGKGVSWLYLGIVGEIGYTIAVPLAVGAIVGSLIDRSAKSTPVATLAGLGIGFVLSIVGFVRVLKDTLSKHLD